MDKGFTNREYEIDIVEYRREFAAVNTRNPESLLAWFTKHPHLSNLDVSRIAGCSIANVSVWRRRAGLPPKVNVRPKPRSFPQIVAPPDWKETNWLVETYSAGCGVRCLANATGKNCGTLYIKLKRAGVKFRPRGSTNPCCNRHWLMRYYLSKKMTAQACADLAGVSRPTLESWLIYFGFRVRSGSEQHAANLGKPSRRTT